jgi:hypothetical protein
MFCRNEHPIQFESENQVAWTKIKTVNRGSMRELPLKVGILVEVAVACGIGLESRQLRRLSQ